MIPVFDFYRFRNIESRSITADSPTGSKGGRGEGRKHAITLAPREKRDLVDVAGPGMVRGFWMTVDKRTPESLRSLVLRVFWDDAESPSVAAPFGDFFGAAHGRLSHYSTPCLGISEGKGFWCFFPMPFSRRFRLEIDNDQDEDIRLFYQINYTRGDEVTPDMGRFHAHFRREVVPLGENHVIMMARDTPGIYVGTLISAIPLTKGTWREGEFQFFIDGDTTAPTICGTGWSDWFLSAWGLGIHQSVYAGSNYQVRHPELSNRYYCGCYRFHLADPIYFQQDLRVEHTQFGQVWEGKEGWGERSDDWCSVGYWYQSLTPKAPLPPLPGREDRVRGVEEQPWEAEALQAIKAKRIASDCGESGLVL